MVGGVRPAVCGGLGLATRALEGVGNVTHAENENGRVSTKKKTPAQKKGRNFFFGRSAAEDNR